MVVVVVGVGLIPHPSPFQVDVNPPITLTRGEFGGGGVSAPPPTSRPRGGAQCCAAPPSPRPVRTPGGSRASAGPKRPKAGPRSHPGRPALVQLGQVVHAGGLLDHVLHLGQGSTPDGVTDAPPRSLIH